MSEVGISKVAEPPNAFVVLWQQRRLIQELTKREVLGRYRGANFGLLWSIFSPFLMLGVYSLAFGAVMKSSWPQPPGSHAGFSVILFVGLIVHGMLAECMTRAPMLIASNPNFVKRVVFPLETLPCSMVGSAAFHALANLLVLGVMMIVTGTHLPWTFLLTPLVMLPLVFLCLGMSWFFASLGVYFRDLGQITGVVAAALLFLSSAVVPMSNLSPELQSVFHLNPLTFIIDQEREVALWGNLPDWSGLGLFLLASIAVAWGGLAWFRLTRRGFADVL